MLAISYWETFNKLQGLFWFIFCFHLNKDKPLRKDEVFREKGNLKRIRKSLRSSDLEPGAKYSKTSELLRDLVLAIPERPSDPVAFAG